jgi:DNA-directed RNA polymerase alpha subunit
VILCFGILKKSSCRGWKLKACITLYTTRREAPGGRASTGAQHEFATLTGIVEDVADIVLNLKKIKFNRGFFTGDENKRADMPLGVIAIDSIFSPIIRVKYSVENTRVGQRTDLADG